MTKSKSASFSISSQLPFFTQFVYCVQNVLTSWVFSSDMLVNSHTTENRRYEKEVIFPFYSF